MGILHFPKPSVLDPDTAHRHRIRAILLDANWRIRMRHVGLSLTAHGLFWDVWNCYGSYGKVMSEPHAQHRYSDIQCFTMFHLCFSSMVQIWFRAFEWHVDGGLSGLTRFGDVELPSCLANTGDRRGRSWSDWARWRMTGDDGWWMYPLVI